MKQIKPGHPRQCSGFTTSRVVAGNLGDTLAPNDLKKIFDSIHRLFPA